MSDTTNTEIEIFKAQAEKLIDQMKSRWNTKWELTTLQDMHLKLTILEAITWAYNQALADSMRALCGSKKFP